MSAFNLLLLQILAGFCCRELGREIPDVIVFPKEREKADVGMFANE